MGDQKNGRHGEHGQKRMTLRCCDDASSLAAVETLECGFGFGLAQEILRTARANCNCGLDGKLATPPGIPSASSGAINKQEQFDRARRVQPACSAGAAWAIAGKGSSFCTLISTSGTLTDTETQPQVRTEKAIQGCYSCVRTCTGTSPPCTLSKHSPV
jgi:hypothetical protein